MTNSYEIKTISDFLLVPADRLDDCLEEFKTWCQITTPLTDATRALADAIGLEGKQIEFVHGFTWIDDGEKNISVNFDEVTP